MNAHLHCFSLVKELRIAPQNPRPGLACDKPKNGKLYPARVRWFGKGKVAPPFFLTKMENGQTEIAALQGTFYEIVLVRIRHRRWLSFAQWWNYCMTALNQGRCWDHNADDYV